MQMLVVQVGKPIRSVELVGRQVENEASSADVAACSGVEEAAIDPGEQQALQAELEAATALFRQAHQILEKIAAELNEQQSQLFRQHSEQIAKLSVEIARKILAKKIDEGDYEIQAIVAEALRNVPRREAVVVHVNPRDLAVLEQARQQQKLGELAEVQFVADPGIQPAECRVESPKGVVESLIHEHLEQIYKALAKVQ